MAFVYKKFTAQDKALIPFNAHKQYNLNSSSAASNKVTYYNTQWTSESISLYSSASAAYGGDTKNIVKYNQIDNLFYRDFKTSLHNKLGPINYLKQPRNFYKKANIISIPMGLFGNEIKPQSFYLSSSTYEVVDDKYGNLIISGTNVNNYPNNVNENVFRLDPVNGFKKYDLGVYNGYAVVERVLHQPDNPDLGSLPIDPNLNIIEKKHWRQGSEIPNAVSRYTSHQKECNI